MDILTNNPLWPVIVATLLIPAMGAWTQKWITSIKQKRTLERVNKNPLLQEGLCFNKILMPDLPERLMGAGRIVSIKKGEAIVETLNGKIRLPLTVEELEKAHLPIITGIKK